MAGRLAGQAMPLHRLGDRPRPALTCKPARAGRYPKPHKAKATRLGWPLLCEAPGSDLLSHGLSHTTIGADAFHFRVRDGIGWYHVAMSAREAVRPVAFARLASMGLGRNKASLSPAMCRRSHLELYDQAARIISIG